MTKRLTKKCKLCREFDVLFRQFSCDLWIERRLKEMKTNDVNKVKACNQFCHKEDIISIYDRDKLWKWS